MPQCIACQQDISDGTDLDRLEIFDIPRSHLYQRLYQKLGYEPPITLGAHRSYSHFRCLSNHTTLLIPEHHAQWTEWRIRQLEQQLSDARVLIQDLSTAIQHIDPGAYFEYIEEPSLNRRRQGIPPNQQG